MKNNITGRIFKKCHLFLFAVCMQLKMLLIKIILHLLRLENVKNANEQFTCKNKWFRSTLSNIPDSVLNSTPFTNVKG